MGNFQLEVCRDPSDCWDLRSSTECVYKCMYLQYLTRSDIRKSRLQFELHSGHVCVTVGKLQSKEMLSQGCVQVLGSAVL